MRAEAAIDYLLNLEMLKLENEQENESVLPIDLPGSNQEIGLSGDPFSADPGHPFSLLSMTIRNTMGVLDRESSSSSRMDLSRNPELREKYNQEQKALQDQLLAGHSFGHSLSKLLPKIFHDQKNASSSESFSSPSVLCPDDSLSIPTGKVFSGELGLEEISYDPIPQRAFLTFSKANVDVLEITMATGHRIKNILNPVIALRFKERWDKLKKKYGENSLHSKPELAFHGTSTVAYASIVKKGLIIPGFFNGVRKIHGSVYGQGIYCSPNPNVAKSYSRGYLLVLAILPGVEEKECRKKGTRVFIFQAGLFLFFFLFFAVSDSIRSIVHLFTAGDIWVMFKPSQVLPLYAITS